MRYAVEPIVAAQPARWLSRPTWWELLYRGTDAAIGGAQRVTLAAWRDWYATLPASLAALVARLDGARVSVNVSSGQLLDTTIRVHLAELAGLGGRLALEWTEDPLADAAGRREAARFLTELRRRHAVAIGIDDLGAGDDGFGRLIALRERPDFVKFDGDVLRTVHASPELRALLRDHVRAYRGQGIAVVAEHVETRDHWTLAGELGLDFVQGFLFDGLTGVFPGAKPVAA